MSQSHDLLFASHYKLQLDKHCTLFIFNYKHNSLWTLLLGKLSQEGTFWQILMEINLTIPSKMSALCRRWWQITGFVMVCWTNFVHDKWCSNGWINLTTTPKSSYFMFIFSDWTRRAMPMAARRGSMSSRRWSACSPSTLLCCQDLRARSSNVTWSFTCPPPATASPCLLRRCRYLAPVSLGAMRTMFSLVETSSLSQLILGKGSFDLTCLPLFLSHIRLYQHQGKEFKEN